MENGMFGGVEMKIRRAFPSGDLPVTRGKKENGKNRPVESAGWHSNPTCGEKKAARNAAGSKDMNCICCTPSRPDRLDCHWHCSLQLVLVINGIEGYPTFTSRRVGRSTHYPIG